MPREREGGAPLGKCEKELKRKGADLDPLKEVDALLRTERACSRVQRRASGKWSATDLATIALLVISRGVTRFVLCS